jgi:hypothetical protein
MNGVNLNLVKGDFALISSTSDAVNPSIRPVDNAMQVIPPFQEFSVSISGWEDQKAMKIILAEIKRVILDHGYYLRGVLDPEQEVRDDESAAWEMMYQALKHLVQNLRQHEYPKDKNLLFRVYPYKDPYEGIRLEFVGLGKFLLPKYLTTKPFFSHVDRPWSTQVAPEEARSSGTGRGQGVNMLFDGLRDIEEAWKLPPDQHVLVGWREANEGEGLGPRRHVISFHFPAFPPTQSAPAAADLPSEANESKRDGAMMTDEQVRQRLQNQRILFVDDNPGLRRILGSKAGFYGAQAILESAAEYVIRDWEQPK